MLKYFWRNHIADRLTEAVKARIGPNVAVEQNRALVEKLRALEARLAGMRQESPPSKMDLRQEWLRNFFIPNFEVYPTPNEPFMPDGTCGAKDFFHPEFSRICRLMDVTPAYHRKIWEWVFIVHHLQKQGVLKEGARGLGFGVGTEPLPSMFARIGALITATDAPAEIGLAAGWQNNDEFARSLDDLFKPGIVDRATFDAKVSYQPCDMTAINGSLKNYDFCWSSCCFEHLGSLRAGLDFVRNTVEQTLRIGGVACHTTEFNLSSNTETSTSGPTVIYRRCDIEAFVQEMRDRGHQVDEFRIAPASHSLDSYVDTPPYIQNPHLKLRLMDYTTTSAGLIIRRGV
jgi:hypothetical protein